MALKEEIRRRREQLGMTQLRFALALGITPATVSKWETGVMSPKLKRMADVAKMFGITEQELMFPKKENEETRNET